MNLATALLPDRVVDALGWTLFHSLWQGALAALGFAVILYFTRRFSPRVRYVLGLMALVLTLAASLATFAANFSGPGGGAEAAAPTSDLTPAGTAPALRPQAVPAERSAAARIAAFFTDYFGRNLPLFVTLWLLGVLFLGLRFTGGLLYVQRLKYRQNRPLPEVWQQRLQRLAGKAGLKRPLLLLESLRLRAPVVIGHLKPVLLVPAGLVTGLPAAEVEALLAHELAHVMRRDYLVNVLQHAVDILYFFHPGVRWISACVRQEREHCCDDFAVELCGDAQPYARALARLQVEGVGYPEPALAAVGRPRRLLRRIVRLLGSPRLAHDFREGFVSALLLVAGLLGIMRMAGAASATNAAPVTTASPAGPTAAALPANRFALVNFILETDGMVRLIGENQAGVGGAGGTWLVDDGSGQVVWYMDLASKARKRGGTFGDEIALDRGSYSWYRPAGWRATAQWRRASGTGAWQPLTMLVGKYSGDELKRKEFEAQAKMAKEASLAATEETRRRREHELQLKLEQAEAELREREKDQRRVEEELRAKEKAGRALAEEEKSRLELEQETIAHELRAKEFELQKLEQEKLMELKRQEMEAQLMELKKQGMEAQEALFRADQERLEVEQGRLKAEEAQLKTLQENITKFTEALAAGGLIDLKKGYEVEFSPTGLTIDGKKQPQEVFLKYRQFYEKVSGMKLEKGRTVTLRNDGE